MRHDKTYSIFPRPAATSSSPESSWCPSSFASSGPGDEALIGSIAHRQVARSCHARVSILVRKNSDELAANHVQAAYYLDNCNLVGIENQIFFFIVIEKEPPYLVRCPKLVGEVINVGKQLYQRDLPLYR